MTNAVKAAVPVPTVSSSVTVDWGSWAAQALKNEQPIIDAAAEQGVTLALATMPFGSIIAMFVGPTVVAQYVDQALTALEGLLSSENINVSSQNVIETYVANLMNKSEPFLVGLLGPDVDTLISSTVAKALAALPAPAANSTQINAGGAAATAGGAGGLGGGGGGGSGAATTTGKSATIGR